MWRIGEADWSPLSHNVSWLIVLLLHILKTNANNLLV